MKHRTYAKMLARRGELTLPEEQRLRAHLATCAECRDLEAEYALQDVLLRPLGHHLPPRGLRDGIMQAVDARPAPQRHTPARSGAMAAGAALAAVMVAVAAAPSLSNPPWMSRPHLLTQHQAVQAALPHTVIAPYQRLPRSVRVVARVGTYAGVHPAWLVTIFGSGVAVLPPPATPQTSRGSAPRAVHRETVVIDGRTGSYVETYVSAD